MLYKEADFLIIYTKQPFDKRRLRDDRLIISRFYFGHGLAFF